MRNVLKSTVVTAGLAIFSMLFGAANLMFPVQAGVNSGDKFIWGIAGFLTTAVLLPVIGLIAVILFDGNYKTFFNRLGKIPGFLSVAFCMAVIGPFIAMSRIVTLSYTMLLPFLPHVSLPIFSVVFCGITFLATYRENKIIDLLGHVISPALLISLGIILIKGMLHPTTLVPVAASNWNIFYEQAKLGYGHLDLLGGIFFASIVLTILKKTMKDHNDYDVKTLAWTAMKAGLFGCTLLGFVYTGMAFLGAFYGKTIQASNGAELFSRISFKIMGTHGAFIIAIAVAMACFSTIIALATILAEYVQVELTNNKVEYIPCLVGVLGFTSILSCYGLTTIMELSMPIIETCYPVIIVITLLNIAYKLWGFTPIKIPTAIALVASIYVNFM
ncbi:MAG: LIVCS family branched-chain amino acid:cation transporter [Alteromonas naphthalenivorans]|jgi:LIVCS family branched-chain amino acid:cation transporter